MVSCFCDNCSGGRGRQRERKREKGRERDKAMKGKREKR